MKNDKCIQLLLIHHLYILKNETQMFYVARVIKFSAFSKLLRKSTSLVPKKIHMLRPPRVEPV